MSPEERKRGRPPGPAGSALGEYLRGLRLARGWTIRDLARAVGLPASSAAYLSQMESGTKVPHAELAGKLAEQLGDPKGVFPWWSEIGRRSDPRKAAVARRELSRILEDPSIDYDPRLVSGRGTRFEEFQRIIEREEPGSEHRFEHLFEPKPIDVPENYTGQDVFVRLAKDLREIRKAVGYRVPLLPDGMDPVEVAVDSEGEVLRLPAEVLGSKRLYRPFAYRVSESTIRRVATLVRPGDVVVISQEPVPLVEHEVYAVRTGRRVELAHAMWNGHAVLLLPDTGKSDFLTLPAPDEAAVARLVVGHMVTIVRG